MYAPRQKRSGTQPLVLIAIGAVMLLNNIKGKR